MTERLSRRNRTRGLYDRISRAYGLIADSSEHAVRDDGVRALGVSRGQRVLETGCGTGHGLVSLADDVGQARQVHGVDLSWGMMAVARRCVQSAALRNVSLTIGDARALFRSSLFDAVFMSLLSNDSTERFRTCSSRCDACCVLVAVWGIVAMADKHRTGHRKVRPHDESSI